MPASGDDVRQPNQELFHYFVGEATVVDALTKICHAVLEAVPPAAMAGVSMTVDARVGTHVFSHSEIVGVDESQYDTGDGPCVDAFNLGEPVIIRSTRRPGPYERFRAVAAREGMLSVMSLPMTTHVQTVGALNLYGREEDAFDEGSLKVGMGFATKAGYLLLNHQAYWDAQSLTENLSQALQSRAVIEQAKGIIMAATGKSPEDAFAELRRQSQHENVKLRDVAREVVERAQRNAVRSN